ncbi:YeeE/YedE family protein [Desulfuromonas sp. KJ2020]|uniref:YeeE/YedE thiosulfate transporter family protein n=1 Tax=Desulfuromonas sp. KJ2020 TaxID=2919173 RepID=UPI0020A7F605|nr:YeeE/YedE thiosulfate transporter family protein [Desulfuromonas sp. KJ2020]MCP3176129.1 YeeE/YedE family protein [Desulfuromonas sp. KJ2020]
MDFLMEVRWSPYTVGIGLGVLSWFSFLVSGKPLACSTTFARLGGRILQALQGQGVEDRPYYQKIGLALGWQGLLVLGVVLGAFVSALLSGDFHWQWVPTRWALAFGDSPLRRVVVALVGGIFLGFGARWAGGCTSGHGISGTLQLAVSSWISAICFFIGGILAAFGLFALAG